MIQNVLRHIGGVDAYGVISICIFFLFFISMLVYAVCLRKPFLQTMAAMPLNDEPQLPAEEKISHE